MRSSGGKLRVAARELRLGRAPPCVRALEVDEAAHLDVDVADRDPRREHAIGARAQVGEVVVGAGRGVRAGREVADELAPQDAGLAAEQPLEGGDEPRVQAQALVGGPLDDLEREAAGGDLVLAAAAVDAGARVRARREQAGRRVRGHVALAEVEHDLGIEQALQPQVAVGLEARGQLAGRLDRVGRAQRAPALLVGGERESVARERGGQRAHAHGIPRGGLSPPRTVRNAAFCPTAAALLAVPRPRSLGGTVDEAAAHARRRPARRVRAGHGTPRRRRRAGGARAALGELRRRAAGPVRDRRGAARLRPAHRPAVPPRGGAGPGARHGEPHRIAVLQLRRPGRRARSPPCRPEAPRGSGTRSTSASTSSPWTRAASGRARRRSTARPTRSRPASTRCRSPRR